MIHWSPVLEWRHCSPACIPQPLESDSGLLPILACLTADIKSLFPNPPYTWPSWLTPHHWAAWGVGKKGATSGPIYSEVQNSSQPPKSGQLWTMWKGGRNGFFHSWSRMLDCKWVDLGSPSCSPNVQSPGTSPYDVWGWNQARIILPSFMGLWIPLTLATILTALVTHSLILLSSRSFPVYPAESKNDSFQPEGYLFLPLPEIIIAIKALISHLSIEGEGEKWQTTRRWSVELSIHQLSKFWCMAHIYLTRIKNTDCRAIQLINRL